VTAVARPSAIAVHPTAALFGCLFISLPPIRNATRSVAFLKVRMEVV
jgi:hypothetical protein